MDTLIKQLESVLTIDGKGRPEKARMLLKLLQDTPQEQIKAILTEIGQRKFF